MSPHESDMSPHDSHMSPHESPRPNRGSLESNRAIPGIKQDDSRIKLGDPRNQTERSPESNQAH